MIGGVLDRTIKNVNFPGEADRRTVIRGHGKRMDKMIRNSLAGLAMVLAVVAVVGMPLAANAGSDVVASGTFTGASNHTTSGGVTVVQTDSGAVGWSSR